MKLTGWCWQWSEQTRKQVTSGQHTHIHKIRPFSKTHLLMLAMENKQTRRETGHLWLHKKRQFSKTHPLTLAREGADKEVTSGQTNTNTTQDQSLKLTDWCGQWSKQRRREKVTSCQTHIHNTRPFCKTHLLMFALKGEDKERNRLNNTHKHNTRPFCDTHYM